MTIGDSPEGWSIKAGAAGAGPLPTVTSPRSSPTGTSRAS
jgi:hypothetical protein